MQKNDILLKGSQILTELEERVGATVAQNALDNVRKQFQEALKAVISAVTQLFESLLDSTIKDFQRATALDPEQGDLNYSHMPVRDVLQSIQKTKQIWQSQQEYDFNDLVKLAKKTRDLEILAEEKLGMLDSIPSVKVIISQQRVQNCIRQAVEVVMQGGKRPSFLIQPMPGRGQLLLGNLDTYEVIKNEVAIEFPRNCSSCQVCDRVFVCGGLNMNQERVRSCWCVLDTCAVLKKADMLEIRSALATTHCSGWVYATGGLNGQHRLATCERYRIEKDEWQPFPVLNTPRSSHAICSFNDRFLYVFCGGQAGKLSLTTVERIEIDTESSWTTIELAKQDQDWLPRSMIGAQQISPNQILIYGDQNRNNLTYLLTHRKQGASLQKLVTQVVPAVYGYRYTRVAMGGFLFTFTDTFDCMWTYEHVTKQWNCCGKASDVKLEGEQLNY